MIKFFLNGVIFVVIISSFTDILWILVLYTIFLPFLISICDISIVLKVTFAKLCERFSLHYTENTFTFIFLSLLFFSYPSDGLVRRLQELEKVATMYKGMMEHTKKLLRGFFDLAQAHKGSKETEGRRSGHSDLSIKAL